LLAVSALVLVLAAPLPAQTMRLAASIPFEFAAGSRTLPAGDYAVDSLAATGAVRVFNENTHDAAVALSTPLRAPTSSADPEVKLVFNRYGNQYFLSRIWDGHSALGRELPISKAERALLAESRLPETLVILARR